MITFEVNGKAAPAGSKRGFVAGGRVVITDMSKHARPWKALVIDAALEAYSGPLLLGPLALEVIEYRLRPQSHFGKRGLNKKGREHPHPTSAPDCLKIARAIEDALSGVIYRDDSQIVDEHLWKRWGDRQHVKITIREVKYGGIPSGPYSDGTRFQVGGTTADQGSPNGSDADKRREGSDSRRVSHL